MINLIESTARNTEVCNVGSDYETLYSYVLNRTAYLAKQRDAEKKQHV